MTHPTITCDRFEALLGDFLEEGLDATTRQACEAHRLGCASCAALVADLDTIVTAAATLPPPVPSRDLWAGIEARLETPVTPLNAPRAATATRPTFITRKLAVAAVALVTASAGLTWTIAQRTQEAAVTTVASGDRVASSSRDAEATSPNAIASRTDAGVSATPVAAGASRLVAIDTLYGRDIALLRDAAEGTLGTLDSSTVAVVRRNLDIIDQAIRESREALAADPNSGFLLEQLDRAYERKVDLLRRLALL
ncbi:MAG: zf-HC2 domain-containing protein [Gemmatimonadaceae bacterium]|jgi:hypothetical protein|nr:zf-HC2 domain-containing protein [Gemmatimonadaceae bacterium]